MFFQLFRNLWWPNFKNYLILYSPLRLHDLIYMLLHKIPHFKTTCHGILSLQDTLQLNNCSPIRRIMFPSQEGYYQNTDICFPQNHPAPWTTVSFRQKLVFICRKQRPSIEIYEGIQCMVNEHINYESKLNVYFTNSRQMHRPDCARGRTSQRETLWFWPSWMDKRAACCNYWRIGETGKVSIIVVRKHLGAIPALMYRIM